MNDFREDESLDPAPEPESVPAIGPAADSASLAAPAQASAGAEEGPVELTGAEHSPATPVEPSPPVPFSSAPEPGFVSFAPPGQPPTFEPQLFQSFIQPPVRPPVRIPHLGHLGILMMLIGDQLRLYRRDIFSRPHILHIPLDSLSQAAATNVPLLLGSEAVLYFVTFALSFVIFPLFWNEKFFARSQWRGAVALHRFWPLAATALGCAGLAALDEVLMPGPSNAPIEKMIALREPRG